MVNMGKILNSVIKKAEETLINVDGKAIKVSSSASLLRVYH